jgi:hypothetical protein
VPNCPSSHGKDAFLIRPHQLPCAASVNAFPDADFSLAAKFIFHILTPRPDSSKQSAGFYNSIEVAVRVASSPFVHCRFGFGFSIHGISNLGFLFFSLRDSLPLMNVIYHSFLEIAREKNLF